MLTKKKNPPSLSSPRETCPKVRELITKHSPAGAANEERFEPGTRRPLLNNSRFFLFLFLFLRLLSIVWDMMRRHREQPVSGIGRTVR
jgi:hypothetical protein